MEKLADDTCNSMQMVNFRMCRGVVKTTQTRDLTGLFQTPVEINPDFAVLFTPGEGVYNNVSVFLDQRKENITRYLD